MIKVSYITEVEGMTKPEKTNISIFDNRYLAQYSVPNKAKTVRDKMVKDGRTGVLLSRGLLIQNFYGKTQEEILEIVKKDIENGVLVAQEESKKKVEIKDLVIEKKE